MPPDTTSQQFFEEMYSHNQDPCSFASSAYELKRYDTIMDALSMPHYRHAFEPGCSVGVLAERLAARCDAVDASDLSPTAVKTARERCSHLANVKIACASLDEVLLKDIDLLVLSEIGYYFERERWRALVEQLINGVAQGGTILAAHWLGYSADHLQHGDDVHHVLCAVECMSHEYAERNVAFRIDRWRKR